MNRELQLIQKILGQFSSGTNAIVANGDDAAVLRCPSAETVISTDSMVEGVHFKRQSMAATDVAYKFVTAAVSDIYAMGARPDYILCSAALPSEIDIGWTTKFIEGLQTACELYNIKLVGGDTTASKGQIFLNATVTGSAWSPRSKIICQDGAREGDWILLSKPVGRSAAGLKLIQNHPQLAVNSWARKLVQSFLRPVIDLKFAKWLAEQEDVTAATDISDGIDLDIDKILRRSRVGAEIEISNLPKISEVEQLCSQLSIEPYQVYLSSGEEYSMIFTIKDIDSFLPRYRQQFKQEAIVIGRVKGSEKIYTQNKKEVEIDLPSNFYH